jgi:hypothetical protein
VDRPDITYHVGYRTYPPGTAVETLTMDKLSRLLGPIEQVGTLLNFSDPYRIRRDVKPQRVAGKVLEPGGRWEFDGALPAGDGAAVRELRVRVRNSERIAEQLRALVLTATFDGTAAPQVECPLGDFFGTAPGVNRYRTLPLAVGFANFNPFNPPQYDPTDQVELTSRWRMPYRRSAHFAVRNTGKTPAEIVEAEVVAVPQPFAAGRTLYLHARWQPGPVPKPPREWEIAKVEGPGVFAGVALSARDVAAAGWGSGGERITVDGEAFPSYFGTGVAHYFGCRGGDPKLFQQAYHARTRRDGPDNGEQTGLVRFQILDSVPFRKSLRFDFAGLYPEAGAAVTGGAVVYYYAEASGARSR